jgi:hypothetical protein
VLAAEVRTCEATILAQRIGQATPRLDADRALITVYRESDVLFGHLYTCHNRRAGLTIAPTGRREAGAR